MSNRSRTTSKTGFQCCSSSTGYFNENDSNWFGRQAASSPLSPEQWVEEIPYGLQVSEDGTRLVGNRSETDVIVRALDLIVDDWPLSRVAEQLNQRGYRTRDGGVWTATELFELLPRMIQLGPRLFTSEEWLMRRDRLPRATV